MIARVRGVMASATSVRIDVVGVRIDVDENRSRAAISDTIGRRDERMAGGDHLIARRDIQRGQGEVQGGGAIGYCASKGRADQGREVALEGGNLRTL